LDDLARLLFLRLLVGAPLRFARIAATMRAVAARCAALRGFLRLGAGLCARERPAFVRFTFFEAISRAS
jgi:hypothetical protein